MTYVLYGCAAAYLLWGIFLTHSLLSGLRRRRTIVRDWLLGPLVLPVLFVVGLVFMACEKLWARLLVMLDYEPPEQMRAGPVEPSSGSKGAS